MNYALSLDLPDTKAVFFAFDTDEASAIRREWRRADPGLPLEIVEAPFRDLGDPLLRYLRLLTADPEVAASVIMPELVFSGARRLLHNQRALYIKRLLLFEPRVLLRASRTTCRRGLVSAPAIMVAYDGSSAARRALVHAVDLVGRSGTVMVVNVIRAQSVSARLETVSDAQRQPAAGAPRRSPLTPREPRRPLGARGGVREPVHGDSRGGRTSWLADPRGRPWTPLASRAQRLARDKAGKPSPA